MNAHAIVQAGINAVMHANLKREHKVLGLVAFVVPVLLMSAAFYNAYARPAPAAINTAHVPVEVIKEEPPLPPLPDMAVLEQTVFGELIETRLSRVHNQMIKVRPGATLSNLLENAGVDRGEAARAITALSRTYNPRQLRAGQMLTLSLESLDTSVAKKGVRYHLAGLTTKPDVTRTVLLEREHNGDFSARELVMDLEKGETRARGSIDSSLYVDGLAAGANDAVIAAFAQLYAYSVDFQRGIRPGDRFDMVFEDYRDDRGNSIKSGNLIYAMLAPRGKEKAFYRFETPDGEVGYYNAEGQSAKRFLMKTPIKGARISSGFGRRMHPVLGYTRKHKGTDFAAVTGTPIMAAGNGVIERASRYGSYGNYVRIRHSNGYKTAYAHMSKYGRGIRKGRRVTQGQIIGYVGATGRVTGAHLHYEVLKNGRQVNPMTVKVPTGRKLKANELKLFAKEKARIDELIKNARPAKIVNSQLASAGQR
ncbi:MAG: peptidoglycan DD-metalloendopeptidase family protein [Robiginitomaculum sp.]|nr:peptidoglycan DD-metalloendopeptidase family protein [Robiginitomaculum sp.]MDQ7076567.1 peptidoglycan DD-metalloendopeptidase family protein [Robiginitomaculum sp.]